MPPRGSIADAKDFANRHGAWIAARLGGLPKAIPLTAGMTVPLRSVPHRIVHRAGERGTVAGPRPATAARKSSALPAGSSTSIGGCTISSS